MRGLRREQREDKINRYIREQIRSAREQRGMTQADLAKFIYKSRVAMSDIERGRVQVSASDLSLMASALEKPVAYFYPPVDRGVEESDLSPEEKELVHYYRQIAHKPLQLVALKQVTTLAESAIQADLETLRQEFAQQRLAGSDPHTTDT